MKDISRSIFGRISRTANTGDRIFQGIALFFALHILGFLGLITYKMVEASWPSLERFGVGFLVDTTWDPVFQRFGALTFIYGTVTSSLLALLIAVPLGLGTAIYLSEMAHTWIRTLLSFLVEMLAAIPSVVYGLWGVFVLVPWLRQSVEPWLGQSLGFLPLFQGPAFGVGLLAGALILAIMILPTIAAVSRDVIRAVPNSQREAMWALGATRWEVISGAVLPFAGSGIIGAIILGLGRALGETMAVTMVIGNRPEIAVSLFAPAYTMASVIANEFTEATYDLYLAALTEIGLVLLGITIILNALARIMVGGLVSRSRG